MICVFAVCCTSERPSPEYPTSLLLLPRYLETTISPRQGVSEFDIHGYCCPHPRNSFPYVILLERVPESLCRIGWAVIRCRRVLYSWLCRGGNARELQQVSGLLQFFSIFGTTTAATAEHPGSSGAAGRYQWTTRPGLRPALTPRIDGSRELGPRGVGAGHPAIRAPRAGPAMERPGRPMRRSILAPIIAVCWSPGPRARGFG